MQSESIDLTLFDVLHIDSVRNLHSIRLYFVFVFVFAFDFDFDFDFAMSGSPDLTGGSSQDAYLDQLPLLQSLSPSGLTLSPFELVQDAYLDQLPLQAVPQIVTVLHQHPHIASSSPTTRCRSLAVRAGSGWRTRMGHLEVPPAPRGPSPGHIAGAGTVFGLVPH